MFKDSEKKKDKCEFVIGSDARETRIHETTQEDINDLLDSWYEVDDDRLPDSQNKPSPTGDTAR